MKFSSFSLTRPWAWGATWTLLAATLTTASARAEAPGQRLDHSPAPFEARGLQEEPSTPPEDLGLLLPRAVLTPPRLIFRLVFLPLRLGIAAVERHKLVEKAFDKLYHTETVHEEGHPTTVRRTGAILPSVSFLSSFGPSLGVTAFYENLAGHGEKGSISALFGGVYSQSYQLAFSADRLGGSRTWLESLTFFESRPRMLFQGLGDEPTGGPAGDPRARAVETRYRQERLVVLERIGYTIGNGQSKAKLGVTGLFSHRDFGAKPEGASDDPSIEQVYDTSKLVGFARGVSTFETSVNLVVDTREITNGIPYGGAYAEAFVGVVPRLQQYGYAHYGAEVTGFFNLYHRNRILIVRGMMEGVEGATENIPFSDLPRLGGPVRLRGYLLDRFRDEKTALATLEYIYPIHANVSGALFVDAGRVANNYEQLFSKLDSVRKGFGAGLLVHTADDVVFSLDVAYGDGINVFFTSNPLRSFYRRELQL